MDSREGICNFNIVKRRKRPENCSPGEINRIVQGEKKSTRGGDRGERGLLILLLLFVGASNTLFLLFLLALQMDRDQVLDRKRRPSIKTLTLNASFSFSARILSAAAWSTYGYKYPRVSLARVGAGWTPSYLFLFFIHLLPLGSQQLSDLTCTCARRSVQRGQGGSPEDDAHTETGIRVLSLDSLSPVLREEHVGGQRPFRRASVLLALGGLRDLFGLL